MKTIITFIVLAVSSIMYAQDGVTITVVFENLKSDEGKVSAALYDQATFMVAAPLKAAEGTPKDKKASLKIENVQPGEYGIITLHDKNENGRMDFEANGMPKEAYGTSNNVMAMGPPNFTDAKFTVGTEDITINIRM